MAEPFTDDDRAEAESGGDQRPGARTAQRMLGDRRAEHLEAGEEDCVRERRRAVALSVERAFADGRAQNRRWLLHGR